MAVLDNKADIMLVYGGLSKRPAVLTDLWSLNLRTNQWHCEQGDGLQCSGPAQSQPKAPGELAFTAGAAFGLYHFQFFGITGFQCQPRVSTGRAGTKFVMSNSVWMLNVATYFWFSVTIAPDSTWSTPATRAFAAAIAPGRNEGYKGLIALIGGANYDCQNDDISCLPQPMNDVWLLDGAIMDQSAVSAPTRYARTGSGSGCHQEDASLTVFVLSNLVPMCTDTNYRGPTLGSCPWSHFCWPSHWQG